MVAITVVLAGVVFLWAQSFTEDTGGGASTLSVDLELETTATTSDVLYVTPLKGNIDWTDYKVVFDGATEFQGATLVDSGSVALTSTAVGVQQDVLVGAGTLTVGEKYNVRIILLEDQSVVLDTNVVCTAA
jgi:hypothetical protein